jgi:hypothetical protein
MDYGHPKNNYALIYDGGLAIGNIYLGKVTEDIILGISQSVVERVTCIRRVFLICRHTVHIILDRGLRGVLLDKTYGRHCDEQVGLKI